MIKERINRYRAETYRITPKKRLLSQGNAIDFVNERGFIFFWPTSGISFPNLWNAAAGDRPVASEHDDPGHITWRWKDELLGQGVWYYAKVVRKKATLIAMDIVPYFYALSENYGSYEADYLTLYEQGRFSRSSKQIYEALLHNGPLDTITLKQVTSMSGTQNNHKFDKSIRDLQADFKILPTGVSQAGGWRYSFIYDLVPRYYPKIIDTANSIDADSARKQLIMLYVKSMGASQLLDIKKFFGWNKSQILNAINSLAEDRLVLRNLYIENDTTEWFAVPELGWQ